MSAHAKCEHCWKDVTVYPTQSVDWVHEQLTKLGWFRNPIIPEDPSRGPWFCSQRCFDFCMHEYRMREAARAHQKVISDIFKQNTKKESSKEREFKKFCRETKIPLKVWAPIIMVWLLIVSLIIKGCV